MAGKRMFSREVIGSDQFADLGFEAQALYLHLCMEADDYGMVGSPRRVQRSIGSGKGALDELLKAGFAIAFESGVVAIADWWRNNTITESRRKSSQYAEELSLLEVTETGSYQLVCEPHADCMQSACKMTASREEVSKEEDSREEVSKPKPKPKRKAYGEYKNVMLSDEELEKLKAEFPNDWKARIEKCSSYCASKGKAYKNYLATIRNWARRDAPEKSGRRDNDVFDAVSHALGV